MIGAYLLNAEMEQVHNLLREMILKINRLEDLIEEMKK